MNYAIFGENRVLFYPTSHYLLLRKLVNFRERTSSSITENINTNEHAGDEGACRVTVFRSRHFSPKGFCTTTSLHG